MVTVADELIPVRRGTLLAVRRLLWDVGSTETTQHDQKVECFHWGAELDALAGMPPWPTDGEPRAAVITYYEHIRDHLDNVLGELRATTEG
jgi:hypothetical protein